MPRDALGIRVPLPRAQSAESTTFLRKYGKVGISVWRPVARIEMRFTFPLMLGPPGSSHKRGSVLPICSRRLSLFSFSPTRGLACACPAREVLQALVPQTLRNGRVGNVQLPQAQTSHDESRSEHASASRDFGVCGPSRVNRLPARVPGRLCRLDRPVPSVVPENNGRQDHQIGLCYRAPAPGTGSLARWPKLHIVHSCSAATLAPPPA